MGTWAEIRDGMKTRLATISGLTARDVMPKTVGDKDFAAVVYGDPLILPAGHATRVAVSVLVIVRISRGDIADGQEAIDAYLWPTGTKSIVAAVNGDRTLGGKVDDTQWVRTGSVGVLEDGAIQADILFRCSVAA